MKVMTTQPVAAHLLEDGLRDPLFHLVDPAVGEQELISRITHTRPNVLITSANRLSQGVVSALEQASRGSWARILCEGSTNAQLEATSPHLTVTPNIAFLNEQEHEAIFRALESDFTRNVTFAPTRALIEGLGRPSLKGTTAILVGGGIVNLMSALRLVEDGCAVTIIESSPSPLERHDWTQYGCSHGGHDARMYSATEYDNYNEKGSSLYHNMGDVFTKPVTEGGWLARDSKELTEVETAWSGMFKRLPPWLARAFTSEIYDIGARSLRLWEDIFARAPLLREHGGYRSGLLRTYADPVKLEESARLQSSRGMLEDVLSTAQIARRYPVFSNACSSGLIHGGLEIKGFTVQIHAFARALIGHLQRQGVQFRWNCRASSFVRTRTGLISGVDTGGKVLTGNHYVISPGAYGLDILSDFKSRELLHGVLGVWCALPRSPEQLTRSVKIKRAAKINEDCNATLATDRQGQPILVLGSGYGYVGSTPANVSDQQLAFLFSELEQLAAGFFPDEYRAARASGLLERSKRFCVRPWTPTGLGVFEVQAAKHGLAIVTGGHNTGGFAIAPAVASAVASALTGQVETTHWSFHPGRPTAIIPNPRGNKQPANQATAAGSQSRAVDPAAAPLAL